MGLVDRPTQRIAMMARVTLADKLQGRTSYKRPACAPKTAGPRCEKQEVGMLEVEVLGSSLAVQGRSPSQGWLSYQQVHIAHMIPRK